MTVLMKIANLLKSNPIELSGSLFLVLIAGIIVLNVTSMQPGSHPAPLFGGKTEAVENKLRDNEQAHTLSVDVWEALKASGYLEEEEQLDQIRISSAIREFQSDNNLFVTGKVSEDLLPHLLMGNLRSGVNQDLIAQKAEAIRTMSKLISDTPTVKVRSEGNSSVMLVQQALANLGYGPLAVDGIMGNATSSAIQKFELDSGMPITGKPSGVLFEKLKSFGALPAQ